MANVVDELWEIRNLADTAWESFHRADRMIESLTGRFRPPIKIGSNVRVLRSTGETFRQKFPGPRTMTWGLTLLGWDVDGNPTSDGVETINDLLEDTMTLIWRTDELVKFRRKWKEAGGLTTLFAAGEVVGEPEPVWTGRTRVKIVVDWLMPDPYWYTDSAMSAGERLW